MNSSTPKFKTILKREINHTSIAKLKATLDQTIWTSLNEVTDANTAYRLFFEIFNRALNQHMPEIKKVVKKTTPVNINPGSLLGITKSKRHKNNIYKTNLRNKSICSNNKYKKNI